MFTVQNTSRNYLFFFFDRRATLQVAPVWNKGSIEQQGWQCTTHSPHLVYLRLRHHQAVKQIVTSPLESYYNLFTTYDGNQMTILKANTNDYHSARLPTHGIFFLIFCTVGGGIKVHSTLRPLNGLLCQPRVIMIMEKSVE
jgi:hypothetical protein